MRLERSAIVVSLLLISAAAVVAHFALSSSSAQQQQAAAMSCGDSVGISREPRLSDEQYRAKLSKEQFYCSRQAGTERPFTGKYHDHHDAGTYTCVSCNSPLFLSSTKFESGTGWPSFYDRVAGAVKERTDVSHGMRRVEALCANCDGHLGHVFDDGPRQKTGKRYCINSASLNFVPDGTGGQESELVDHDNVCAVPPKK